MKGCSVSGPHTAAGRGAGQASGAQTPVPAGPLALSPGSVGRKARAWEEIVFNQWECPAVTSELTRPPLPSPAQLAPSGSPSPPGLPGSGSALICSPSRPSKSLSCTWPGLTSARAGGWPQARGPCRPGNEPGPTDSGPRSLEVGLQGGHSLGGHVLLAKSLPAGAYSPTLRRLEAPGPVVGRSGLPGASPGSQRALSLLCPNPVLPLRSSPLCVRPHFFCLQGRLDEAHPPVLNST